MKVFISYASEDRDLAERIHLALISEGHTTFFDRADLPPADDFNLRIRSAINDADALIFLVSPEAVARGSYALTELLFARKKWRHPRNHVLPVMARPTEWSLIPSFLTAITVLEPEGNIPAEVAHALPLPRRRWVSMRMPLAPAAGFALSLLAAAIFFGWLRPVEQPRRDLQEQTAAITGEPITAKQVRPGTASEPIETRIPSNLTYPISDLWCPTSATKNQIVARAAKAASFEFAVSSGMLQRNGKDVGVAYTDKLGVLDDIRVIVAHFTASSAETAERIFESGRTAGSAHVLIARDGTVKQLVLFSQGSQHAGNGNWKDLNQINRHSVGIELVNWGRVFRKGGQWRSSTGAAVPDVEVVPTGDDVGWHRYSDVQIRTFFDVACALRREYPSITELLGHEDISPGRKIDPGPAFPLDELRRRLFVGRTEKPDPEPTD